MYFYHPGFQRVRRFDMKKVMEGRESELGQFDWVLLHAPYPLGHLVLEYR